IGIVIATDLPSGMGRGVEPGYTRRVRVGEESGGLLPEVLLGIDQLDLRVHPGKDVVRGTAHGRPHLDQERAVSCQPVMLPDAPWNGADLVHLDAGPVAPSIHVMVLVPEP